MIRTGSLVRVAQGVMNFGTEMSFQMTCPVMEHSTVLNQDDGKLAQLR